MKKSIVKKRNFLITVFILLLLGYSWGLTSGKGRNRESMRSVSVANYTDHAAIYIDSDDDFGTLGLPGSGTVAAPYMIENLNITTTDTWGIYVDGTTNHFVIQNCYIKGYQYGIKISAIDGTGTIKNNIVRTEVKMSSITLSSTKSILVEGNDCSEQYQGIVLTDSSSNTIKDNNCSFNNDDGIYTSGTGGNNNIIDNHCEGNTDDGISIRLDDDADYIAGNVCVDNAYGIYMYAVNDGKIINNRFEGNTVDGMYISSCYYLTINQNFCENNGENGIELSYCGGNHITHNTIRTNHENGIRFEFGENNIVSSNLIQGNYLYGVWINGSAAFVSNNDFIDNYDVNNPQAYDFNGESVWYNTTTNLGNYWSDWAGIGSYNIAGKGTTDPYPLSTPVIATISTTTSLSPSASSTTGEISASQETSSKKPGNGINGTPGFLWIPVVLTIIPLTLLFKRKK